MASHSVLSLLSSGCGASHSSGPASASGKLRHIRHPSIIASALLIVLAAQARRSPPPGLRLWQAAPNQAPRLSHPCLTACCGASCMRQGVASETLLCTTTALRLVATAARPCYVIRRRPLLQPALPLADRAKLGTLRELVSSRVCKQS